MLPHRFRQTRRKLPVLHPPSPVGAPSTSTETPIQSSSDLSSASTDASAFGAESSSSEESTGSSISSSDSESPSDTEGSSTESQTDKNDASNNAKDSSGNSKISNGAIGGIVAAIVIVLLAALAYFMWRRKQRTQKFYRANDFVDFPHFDPASHTDLVGGTEKQQQQPLPPPSESSFAPSSFDAGYANSYSNFGSTAEMANTPMPPNARAYNSSNGSMLNRNDDIFLRALDEN
ncbi:hypothetical protein GGI22_003818 [Coemansia erecta]|nr:hypothetical protein GGI22_003818 [Coemansia erecta]